MVSFIAILARFARIVGRSWRDPESRGLVLLVALVLLAGTLFYSRVEGWTILDSLYFSVITLTTVGYGDLYPSTALSKIFTIFYIFVELGIILLFVNKVAERATERRHRKMDRAEDAPDAGSQEEDS